MSSRGPLLRFLRGNAREVTISEYFDDEPAGSYRGNVQCQDVTRLTYPDQAFDLVTSTEVFEHVADDLKGFREVRRVLRPGGHFVFTVPLQSGPTVTRVVQSEAGELSHLLRPEFHSDRARGARKVLCFRNYGEDIVARLAEAGLPAVIRGAPERWFGFARPVLMARRPD